MNEKGALQRKYLYKKMFTSIASKLLHDFSLVYRWKLCSNKPYVNLNKYVLVTKNGLLVPVICSHLQIFFLFHCIVFFIVLYFIVFYLFNLLYFIISFIHCNIVHGPLKEGIWSDPIVTGVFWINCKPLTEEEIN